VKQTQLSFRITLWRPWLLALTPLALLAALGVAGCLVAGEVATAAGILLGLSGLAVLFLVLISLVVWASRWQVDRHGVGGRNN
jgi:hypothetical protein